MKMIYFRHMTPNNGYQISDEDVEAAIRFLYTQKKPCTRDDAIEYLEKASAIAHITAHKIVEDEQNKK